MLSAGELKSWLMLTSTTAGQKLYIVGSAVDETKVIRLIGRHWQLSTRNERHPNSFPAVPAFVTSYARERMRQFMLLCNDENVYRIATDSLLVNYSGSIRLAAADVLDETSIGNMKLESKGDSADIRGVHTFRLGEKWVHGGISSEFKIDAEGNLTDFATDRLETLIESSNSTSFRRLSVVKQNFASYTEDSGKPIGWLPKLSVSWDKKGKKWLAVIYLSRQRKFIGRFVNEIDAAKAYDGTAVELYGQFARLNFPLCDELLND